MEVRHLLLAFVLLSHGLTAVMWWAGGTWLGLSRKAAMHWLVATVSNGLALALMMFNDGWPETPMALLAGVLGVHGAVSLRRGLQAFLKLRHTDRSHLILGIGITLFCLGICLPMGWRTAGIFSTSLVIGWVMWRTARECFGPLRTEFKTGTAWVQSVLLNIAALMFASSPISELLPGVQWPWASSNVQQAQAGLAFAIITASVLSSVLLGYIVVTRLVRRLEHLSHHDALTGLLNRRAIEYLLDREAQRLHRFGEPFTVLMLDIDHFKRVNDRLGHAAGDAVLRAVSDALQAQAREVDRVARFGGEEFCVLLPHTLHEGALLAAERFRDAISQINVPWADESITVSISTGLATANDSLEALSSLLRRADDALYQAKADGRNKVVSAPDRVAST